MEIRKKDMNKDQITHAYCTWCSQRRIVLGHTYWGCALEEDKEKFEELCLHKQAVREEEAEIAKQSGAAH
ncbi:MAG: hypothetical protein AB1815_07875 [Bacillota bacterium]